MSFSHWAHHFLVIFSKVHKFVQNSVFSPRSAHFVIFAPDATLFSYFQQSAQVCKKQRFQNEISIFCHLALGAPLFSDFQQSAGVCTKQVFSLKSARLSFSHWAHYFFAISSKVHDFEQNSGFRTRSARFVIFAVGAPPFSDFQQSARISTKQRFQP